MTAEVFFDTWGLIIAILALAAVIGGGLVSFGRFQGRIGEQTKKHDKDIQKLWEKQHDQDSICTLTTKAFSTLLTRTETMLAALQKSSDELRADVKELLKNH